MVDILVDVVVVVGMVDPVLLALDRQLAVEDRLDLVDIRDKQELDVAQDRALVVLLQLMDILALAALAEPDYILDNLVYLRKQALNLGDNQASGAVSLDMQHLEADSVDTDSVDKDVDLELLDVLKIQ